MSPTKQNRHKKTLLIITLTLIIVTTLSVTAPNAQASTTKPYEFLIIGPQSYESTTQKFIDLKLSQQVLTQYVSTETLKLQQSPEPEKQLHEFVSNEIRQSGIKYLLLLGNYNQVPTRYVYSPSDEEDLADFNYKPTDWYYTVPSWEDSQIGFLGANVPQIAVGRLPVNNQQELERTLTKIIAAEIKPNSNTGLVALSEPSLNLNPTLNVPYTSYTLSLNQTATQLGNVISGNVASYTHGTTSALWTKTEADGWKPLFTQTNVTELKQNFNIFYLVACFTGAIDLKEESLARTLLTSPSGPALVIASSRTEGSDNKIAATFWDKFFESGKVGDSFIQALGNYINDPTVFSAERKAFQRYNFYLDKVIYGDPSWYIEGTQISQMASTYSPPQVNLLLSGGQENQNLEAGFGSLARTIIGSSIIGSLFGSALLITRFWLIENRQVTHLRIRTK